MRTDSRSRILTAASKLFVERGYEGTTLQAVAQEAGVAKGLPSHHFGSKMSLLSEVLEDYYQAHVSALAGAFQGEQEPRARIHALLDAYFDFICAHQGFPRLVQRVSDHEEVRTIIRTRMAPLVKAVEEMLAAICPSDGPQAARHLFLTFSAVVVNYVTYAPLVFTPASEEEWHAMTEERRVHLHWLGDACLDALGVVAD